MYINDHLPERLRSDRFKSLITAVQELEKILESDLLDIEFAIDQKLNVFLLQTRKITTQNKWGKEVVSLIDEELKAPMILWEISSNQSLMFLAKQPSLVRCLIGIQQK